MERLNNNLHTIVGRVSSQRRYQNEQRPAPNTEEQRSQSAPQRRSLPEQRAHLSTRNSYASEQPYTHTNSAKKTQNFSEQEEPGNYYPDRSRRTTPAISSSPATYPQQASEYIHPAGINQPPTVDEAYIHPAVPPHTQMRSRATFHHSDDFGSAPMDEADDIAGIRNDDWEEGLMMNAPASRPPYQYAGAIVKYSHSQGQHAPQQRDVTRVEEINDMREVSRGRTPRPVETRPSLPTRTATPVQRSPLSPAQTQAVGRTQQRNTQPLNSRTTIDPRLAREYPERPLPEAPRQAREYPERPPVQEAPRQQRYVPAVREPMLPYVLPATPAPISQKSVCPKCRGAGYLRANVPFGHPNFGRPIPCECKEIERKDKRRQQLRDISNWTLSATAPSEPLTHAFPVYRKPTKFHMTMLRSPKAGCCSLARTVVARHTWLPLLPINALRMVRSCCSRSSPICLITCVPPSHPMQPRFSTSSFLRCARPRF